MMTRREWLIRVLGATIAAAVAPLVDLTDASPRFWEQPAIKALKPWKITFPDGTMFTFDGQVIAEKLLNDGTIEMTLQPQGPTHIYDPFDSRMAEPVPSPHAPATVIQTYNGVSMELQDIMLPSLESFPSGLENRRKLIFTIKSLTEE